MYKLFPCFEITKKGTLVVKCMNYTFLSMIEHACNTRSLFDKKKEFIEMYK